MCATLYCAASLAHFFHNAEFCGDYPNLPAWISRASVYAVWIGLTAFGGTGLLLSRSRHAALGLTLVAVYAAMGFDGLGHYTLAPMSQHSFTMNFTIWFEVVTGAVLLAATLRALAVRRQPKPL
ncbi:MAG TPA: hypothetical protein VFJ90_06005 [Candidatus Didemnitutus sp.]|nr:hypothetical protein [Candidatus Didemnitutus sp.]